MMKRIAVNGANGRIGRVVTYELSRLPRDCGLELVLLNDPVGVDRVVKSLSGIDPVHGKFDWNIRKIDNDTIEINERKVKVYAEKDPAKMHLVDNGIQIVEECSGLYGNDKNDETRVLGDVFVVQPGVERVIFSYPVTGEGVQTLIAGVNHKDYKPSQYWGISNGSCTTKALAAPIKVLMDNGIYVDTLLMDTVHAATNTQGILDSLNTIATHRTGAAKATGEVISELKERMDGLSFRVATLDGSFANLYFTAMSIYKEDLSAEKLNQILRDNLRKEEYMGRIELFDGTEADSLRNIVGKTSNSVVITSKTRVIKSRSALEILRINGMDIRADSSVEEYARNSRMYHCMLVSGYDNERGPPKDQTLLTKYIAGRF